MPNKLEWVEMIPDAIEHLLDWNGEVVDRKAVERLLSLSPRQATRVLQNAGATIEGKLAVISPQEFILYLEHIGGSGLAKAEKDRRRRFAEKLSAMRRDRIEHGTPLLVEVQERHCEPVRRVGYDGLPPGIDIGPGELRVKFESIPDLLQKLALLAMAMQGDGDGKSGFFPELERRTGAII